MRPVRCDSLSAHTEVNHQGEAGNRAQSEPNQIGTLALKGRYYGERKSEAPEKNVLYLSENLIYLDFITYKPAAIFSR